MRTRIRKTRPALSKGLLQSDVENNTKKKKRNEINTPIFIRHAVTERLI